ncbi:MAG: alkylmercury lyase family protein [Promethearchaeota archaeon]|jgi:hypothetical protein
MEPKSTERTKIIFQDACNTENIDAKLGVSLSNEENSIRRYILKQTPILGELPTISMIRENFSDVPDKKFYQIIDQLDKIDAIHLNENKTLIEAAYPFSNIKTAHLVEFKEKSYKNIYAMCAIDALGIPFMLKSDIIIKSKCFHCGDEITIEIENNEITNMYPENVKVWCHMEYSCCAATSLCNNINFFSSDQHFEEWQKNKKKSRGYLLQISEAFQLGRLFFEKRLQF